MSFSFWFVIPEGNLLLPLLLLSSLFFVIPEGNLRFLMAAIGLGQSIKPPSPPDSKAGFFKLLRAYHALKSIASAIAIQPIAHSLALPFFQNFIR